VAEGVEGENQLSQLIALECQYGQGYFFSKPMPTGSATELLLDTRRNMLVKPQRLMLETTPPAIMSSELIIDLTDAALESALAH
jgi:sensor c-di-GMP phosphodiesterase-like protein